MKRLACVMMVLSALGAAAFVYGPSLAADSTEPAKKPSMKDVKELMERTHKGDDSPLMRVDRGLKADAPNWSEMRKNTDGLVTLAKLLEELKNLNYRLTEEYVVSVKALDKAVDKKDQMAAIEAFKKVKGTCMSCHKDRMP